jgi:hypothetical protein
MIDIINGQGIHTDNNKKESPFFISFYIDEPVEYAKKQKPHS